MKTLKQVLVLSLLAILAGSTALLATPDIKLRFLEGSREGTASGPAAVTSSYETIKLSTKIAPDYSLDREMAQIKKVFNLKDVKLITEAELEWPSRGNSISHVIQFEGREYLILITPKGGAAASKFRVEVYEQTGEGAKRSNLLDTEFQLPANETVVLGFDDSQKTAYFLYLTWPSSGIEGGVEGGILGGVEGGVKGGAEGGVSGGVKGGVEGGVTGGVESGVPGVVRATGDIQPPKLLKVVSPVYPEIAKQAKVEGVVIIEATTDVSGHVIKARVLRSIPLLDQAAVDAVKQWVYEPVKVKGEPKGVVFTVTVNFRLDECKSGGKIISVSPEDQEFTKGAVKIEGSLKPPKLIKVIDPVYPPEAKKAGVEGVVILSARIDTSGKVKAVKVLRSVPALDQAAVDSLKQWVYEPMMIKGKPVEAVFTVTVRFKLHETKAKEPQKK